MPGDLRCTCTGRYRPATARWPRGPMGEMAFFGWLTRLHSHHLQYCSPLAVLDPGSGSGDRIPPPRSSPRPRKGSQNVPIEIRGSRGKAAPSSMALAFVVVDDYSEWQQQTLQCTATTAFIHCPQSYTLPRTDGMIQCVVWTRPGHASFFLLPPGKNRKSKNIFASLL